MRAYLAIDTGDAWYQEREKGLLFGGRPKLSNSGLTPARKVRFKIRAEILSISLPLDFAFREPFGESQSYGIGPRQSMGIPASVETFWEDTEIQAIKDAAGKALYFWGRVTYEDVFEDEHYTDFCYYVAWNPHGGFLGTFIAGHNDAT
jgi:hypothetical protein